MALSGKNILLQQTPRSPLKIKNMEMLVALQDEIPRIPTAKRYVTQESQHFDPVCAIDELNVGSNRQIIRHPITTELTLEAPTTLTYHHRLRDTASFENRHKEVLNRQPTAFRRRRGHCSEQLTQYCFQDRAFNWKSSDGRQSLSPSNSKYLIESLSYDPIDLDISIARTVDFSQSRSLKSRHSTARSKRESRASPISSVQFNVDDDLISSASSSTFGSSTFRRRSDVCRREEEATRSQIAQFEARFLSTSNFSSMSKRDLALLKSAARRQRQDNAKHEVLERLSPITTDDSLAWSCVKPILEVVEDIHRASPATAEVVLPAKKDVLSELEASLHSLKPIPTITLSGVVICDVTCNVNLFCKRSGPVNVVVEKVTTSSDIREIARLTLTKEKMTKYNIPLVHSNKITNDRSSPEATRYYQEKVKGWFVLNVLPRIVLFSYNGVDDYTINLLPFKVSKLKGSTYSLAVVPENQSIGIGTVPVDPDIVRPNPRLVSLYFQKM